jgi:hypothetical protein
LAPAEKVQVQVVDGLAAVASDVEYQTVTVGRDPTVFGQLVRRRDHAADELRVIWAQGGYVFYVLTRYYEDVFRRLRIDVRERDYRIVFVQDVGRRFARGYLTEYAIGHGVLLNRYLIT